ncbi:MAG TPA: hypothetical protein VGF94_18135 [Kofleriaceae bacterium]|jgi:hypothetical protein
MIPADDSDTILSLPDGSQRELVANAPGIRVFHAAGDRMPRFEIDGHRYAVASVSLFSYLPGRQRAVAMVTLVEYEPPPN